VLDHYRAQGNGIVRESVPVRSAPSVLRPE
jgi:hypothetical protein